MGPSDGECLGLPVKPGFDRDDVLFMCPPCHQEGDHIAKRPSPYYVRPMPLRTPTCELDCDLRSTRASIVTRKSH